MSYKEMYVNYYLKSTKKDFIEGDMDESYEAHKEKLKAFGEKYLHNYEKNAENLIDFYNTCKKRKPKKTNREKPIINPYSTFDFSSLNKNIILYNENEDINKKNLNLNKLEDNDIFLGENKISIGIQTEGIQTDDESESENEY